MGIRERILRLEAVFKQKERSQALPNDTDGFIKALGIMDLEHYRVGNGFDFIQAINDTAKDDWQRR